MKWYDSPALVDRLASEYALGTLSGPARRRFEAVMRERAVVGAAVARWNGRLYPMARRLPPVQPRDALWQRIEHDTVLADIGKPDAGRQAAAADRPVVHPPPTPSPVSRWLDAVRAGIGRLLAPVPAGALAFGLALGMLLPSVGPLWQAQQQDTELPESYVGVLATAEGKPGLIVSSLRRGRVMDLKRVAPVVVPEGQTLYLWIIEQDNTVRPVGPIPQGAFERTTLSTEADTLFAKARELAVSREPVGTTPARPSEAFVYRGLCGKLWRVPRTAPAASRTTP
jgi:anti-sigma-K factor RskA